MPANGSNHTVYKPDGSLDFSAGVSSQVVTTIQSGLTPNGLKRNQLSWASNCTMRGGGITQRNGWQLNVKGVSDGTKPYQYGFLYRPADGVTNPYFILCVNGHILQVIPDSGVIKDLSNQFALFLPTTIERAFYAQAGQFLIIQAGDGVTLPLFWDGTKLRQSLGPTQTLGVVNAPFVVPAVGSSVLVTLTGPYNGLLNQVIVINGRLYVEVTTANAYTFTNTGVNVPPAPAVVPAGTAVFLNGVLYGHTLAPFDVPAVGGTVGVAIDTPNTGFSTPQTVTLNGQQWSVTALGSGATPANHVYLVNLTDIVGSTVPSGATLTTVQELPPATCMDYYMGRVWYAQGNKYIAGDIVGNTSSGTPFYAFADSVLKVTENPLAIGGDGFSIPADDGNIRALKHNANLDTTLGQGLLYIFTRKAVYSLQVPVTRTEWIAADGNTQPLQTVALLVNGAVNDISVVATNGDLYFQSLDPAIRTLFSARREFGTWGNVPISRNINRALQFNNRALMRFSSGIEFDNRVLETILPTQLGSGQVVHPAIAVIDFDLVSTLGEKLPPAWEGILEGVQVLELFKGDFGGLPRAFAAMVSTIDGSIQIWELTTSSRTDGGDNRVQWFFETPAFTWDTELELKQLEGGQLWIDRVFGTVEVEIDYRPDASPCWIFWHKAVFCVSRNCTEDVNNPCGYPPAPTFGEGYKYTLVLPEPPGQCDPMGIRSSRVAYQFQARVRIKGFCRIRGIILWSRQVLDSIRTGLSC